MKAVRNIILLFILSITATGIPLYADSINLDSFITPSANSITLEANVENNLSNLLTVEVSLTTDDKHIPISFNKQPLLLQLYAGDKLVKAIDYATVATINPSPDAIVTPEIPVKFRLELDQSTLNLSNGKYTLKIKPISNIQSIDPIDIPIYLHTDFTYKTALQSTKRNETPLVLYFPDTNFNHLVPVTRIIPYTTAPLRKTVDQLLKGPDKALGLPEGSPIPNSKVSLTGRTANIFLPADIGVYQTQSTTARIAQLSYVNSLTSIPEVDNLQFYFNYRKSEIGFHDSYVKDPIAPLKGPKLYFGSITNNARILLTPYEIGIENPSTEILFNMLKISGNVDMFNYSIQATVPDEVELIRHHLDNTTLTLVLNEAFATIYQDKPDHRNLMLESLLYTFTSLEGIEAIQFEIEGSGNYKGYGIPLGVPLKPSKYINPEK